MKRDEIYIWNSVNFILKIFKYVRKWYAKFFSFDHVPNIGYLQIDDHIHTVTLSYLYDVCVCECECKCLRNCVSCCVCLYVLSLALTTRLFSMKASHKSMWTRFTLPFGLFAFFVCLLVHLFVYLCYFFIHIKRRDIWNANRVFYCIFFSCGCFIHLLLLFYWVLCNSAEWCDIYIRIWVTSFMMCTYRVDFILMKSIARKLMSIIVTKLAIPAKSTVYVLIDNF